MSFVRIKTNHRYGETVEPPTDPVDPGTPPPDTGTLYWAASRDVYDVPFESSLLTPDSIWTRPIGDAATRVEPGFTYQNGNQWGSWPNAIGRIAADPEHIFMDPTDPVKTLTVTGGGPGNGQSVRVPASATHDGSLNGGTALIRQANAFTVWQGQPLTLTAGGNPSWKWTIPTWHPTPIDLRAGDETTHWGAHGGSRLSVVAGSIREGVLNSGADMIYHPLKLNVWAQEYLSPTSNGYRWPATTADANYLNAGSQDFYGGTVTQCRMGALVALPSDYNFATEGITEPRALMIGKTLKYYGAYIVDNTAWNTYALSVQKTAIGATGQWIQSGADADAVNMHIQIHEMITALQIIDNNAPGQACAGGGSPLADNLYAPPVTQ